MALTVNQDIQAFKMHADSRGQGKVIKSYFGSTTDATPLVIYSHPVEVLSGVNISVSVVGLKSDATEMIRAIVNSGFRRQAAGNVTEVGADTAIASDEDSAGTPTVTLIANTSSQTVDVTLTGEAAKTIRWEVVVEYLHVSL